MITLNDKALEVVTGGWGYYGGSRVTQTNTSIILLKDFNAKASGGSAAGVGISVIQGNSN